MNGANIFDLTYSELLLILNFKTCIAVLKWIYFISKHDPNK